MSRSLISYTDVISHPEHGEMFNQTLSARYLGVSRRKFRIIATAPDLVQDGIYPFWARRVLDLLPIDEVIKPEDYRRRGLACGKYLLGAMTDEEAKAFRDALSHAETRHRIITHTCGFESATFGMDLLEKAAWFQRNCVCPHLAPKEEVSYILERLGVRVKFHSWRLADAYRGGLFQAIKGFAAEKIREMRYVDAEEFITWFISHSTSKAYRRLLEERDAANA